jgi:adenine-specific DNA-methyltransferase
MHAGGSCMTVGSPTTRKRLGAYYTPRDLADFIARWAVRSPKDHVLDPACGEAAFLQAATERLRELGGPLLPGQVEGYEIDPVAAERSRRDAPLATVATTDFFCQEPANEQCDAVVGNPPYVRYHYFSGRTRDLAIARAEQAGVRLSRLTSSWAPFLVHAASFLLPHGRLALVLPAELLSTDYAASIRAFLRHRFARVHVLAFEQRVFPSAMVDIVVLLAEGEGPGEVRVHRVTNVAELGHLGNGREVSPLSTKWVDGYLTNEATDALTTAGRIMRPLGDIASVDIGIVTGANDFFVLSEDQAAGLGLSRTELRPLAARGQFFTSPIFTTAAWTDLQRQGQPVWLFAPDAPSDPALAYIAQGERRGAHRSYKCSIRAPWWRLNLPAPPDFLLSYMSDHAPILVANDAGVLTTNLLHNVRLGLAGVHLDRRALAVAWFNSATLVSCELRGRSYGGGVLKLETREAERVLVPIPDASTSSALLRLGGTVGGKLRGDHLENLVDRVDAIVLATLTPEHRNALKSARRDLRARRKQRTVPAPLTA